jgi:hypothetical protein
VAVLFLLAWRGATHHRALHAAAIAAAIAAAPRHARRAHHGTAAFRLLALVLVVEAAVVVALLLLRHHAVAHGRAAHGCFLDAAERGLATAAAAAAVAGRDGAGERAGGGGLSRGGATGRRGPDLLRRRQRIGHRSQPSVGDGDRRLGRCRGKAKRRGGQRRGHSIPQGHKGTPITRGVVLGAGVESGFDVHSLKRILPAPTEPNRARSRRASGDAFAPAVPPGTSPPVPTRGGTGAPGTGGALDRQVRAACGYGPLPPPGL